MPRAGRTFSSCSRSHQNLCGTSTSGIALRSIRTVGAPLTRSSRLLRPIKRVESVCRLNLRKTRRPSFTTGKFAIDVSVFSLTLSWEGDFHKVATGAFGFVQHLVGFAQQGGQKLQARRPQAPQNSQSASGRGNRPPVRNVTQSATAFSFSRPTY